MNIKDLIVEESPSDDEEDSSPILVSEFPPPPYYYTLASSLIPPEIPTENLVQVAKQVQKTIASLASQIVKDADKSSFPSSVDSRTTPTVDETMMDIHTVPAVFGEIVEDPLLMHVEDLCEDPTIVRDEILRFVKILLVSKVLVIETSLFLIQLFFLLYVLHECIN